MGKGAGASGNKAQAAVVNKKAKSGPKDLSEEDMAFKAKQKADQAALKAAAAKLKKK